MERGQVTHNWINGRFFGVYYGEMQLMFCVPCKKQTRFLRDTKENILVCTNCNRERVK